MEGQGTAGGERGGDTGPLFSCFLGEGGVCTGFAGGIAASSICGRGLLSKTTPLPCPFSPLGLVGVAFGSSFLMALCLKEKTGILGTFGMERGFAGLGVRSLLGVGEGGVTDAGPSSLLTAHFGTFTPFLPASSGTSLALGGLGPLEEVLPRSSPFCTCSDVFWAPPRRDWEGLRRRSGALEGSGLLARVGPGGKALLKLPLLSELSLELLAPTFTSSFTFCSQKVNRDENAMAMALRS